MSKFVVGATWDEFPHLTAEQKAELWGSIPPYQRDARAKGIPQLGSGAIYPVPESEIVVDPFELPPHWPRGYGLDVGWNRTAAVWGGARPRHRHGLAERALPRAGRAVGACRRDPRAGSGCRTPAAAWRATARTAKARPDANAGASSERGAMSLRPWWKRSAQSLLLQARQGQERVDE